MSTLRIILPGTMLFEGAARSQNGVKFSAAFGTEDAKSIFSQSFWKCCWAVAAERCPAGGVPPVSRVTGRIMTPFCRQWAARQNIWPNNGSLSLSGRFLSAMVVGLSSWLWMIRRRSGMDQRRNWPVCVTHRRSGHRVASSWMALFGGCFTGTPRCDCSGPVRSRCGGCCFR